MDLLSEIYRIFFLFLKIKVIRNSIYSQDYRIIRRSKYIDFFYQSLFIVFWNQWTFCYQFLQHFYYTSPICDLVANVRTNSAYISAIVQHRSFRFSLNYPNIGNSVSYQNIENKYFKKPWYSLQLENGWSDVAGVSFK